MLTLARIAMLPAGPISYLAGITDLDVVQIGGQMRLYSISRAMPGITHFQIATSQNAMIVDQRGLSPTLSTTADPELTFVSYGANMLLTSGLNTLAPYAQSVSSNGSFTGATYWSDPGAIADRLAEVEQVTTSSGHFLYVTRSDGSGLSGLRVVISGPNTVVQPLSIIGSALSHVVSDLISINHGGIQLLVAALSLEHRLVMYAVGDDGSLVQTQSIGAPDGLGMSSPVAMAAASIGGEKYVIAASSLSSTLTVFRVGTDGRLIATDNIVDSLTTRFSAASQVETVATHERVFVLGSGNDDGVSLFTLLPGGRLLHIVTITDTSATTLANVSAISAAVMGEELQVFVASGTEAGLTQFTFDLSRIGLTLSAGSLGDTLIGGTLDDLLSGGSGDDVLSGGAGRDILTDGEGRDRLTGGSGADTFVFSADGHVDVVVDFNPAEDRLDLSAFPMLYSVRQLVITPTASGAILEFAGERVEINSFDGQTLLRDSFTDSNTLNLTRSPDRTEVTSATLWGTDGQDDLIGGVRHETFFGFGGADRLSGGSGIDVIYGGEGGDWLEGESGDDRLFGDGGADTLIGGSGYDELSGGNACDLLLGGFDNDSLNGGDGADVLLGDLGDDRSYGGEGNDYVSGGSGNDLVSGDEDGDTLLGGQGNDTLLGGDGHDILFGGTEPDQLFGGNGNDRLHGQSGADLIDGGAGDDFLLGEGGADVFVFHGNFGNDTIADFESVYPGEVIDISATGVADFADLRALISEADGAVVLTFANGYSIMLLDTAAAELSADDFVF